VITRDKVLIYLTRQRGEGTELLVFEHVDFPEAEVQVPAGSIDPGETAVQAALREAYEEAGLTHLLVICGTGPFLYHNLDAGARHRRHVFLVTTTQPLPDTWTHVVSSGAGDKGLRFSYYWLDTKAAVHALSGGQGDYLLDILDLVPPK
jgi:8-oxo-dGTP diphosphatase